MKDQDETREQPEAKLAELRRRVAILEAVEVKHEQAKEVLREEKDKAQKYLEIAGVIIVAIDADQTVTMVNRKGCEILGGEEEEIVGRNWFDNFIPDRERDETKAVFTRLMAGEIEPVEHFENPVLTRSGEERVIAWHNTVLTNEAGDIIGTLASGTDITERKQAEEALQIAGRQWRITFDAIGDAVCLLTLEGIILRCNEATARLLEKPPREIVGRVYWELVYGTSEPIQECPVVRMQETQYRETMVLPMGSRWMNVVADPLMGEADRLIGTVYSMTDITERKRAEAEMIQLDILGAKASSKVFLLNEQTGELTLSAYRGEPSECPCFVRPLQLGECLCGLAAQWGKVVISDDAGHDEQHSHCWAEMPPHKDVCLPLKARDKVLGVMSLWLPQGQKMFAGDLGLLTTIGDQIGVAIENAQLYEQAQQRTWELAALNKTAQILASSLDLKKVLAQAMAEAMEMLGAESASVLLHDPASDELVFTTAVGPDSEVIVGARMPATAGIAGWVLQERQPVLVRNAQSDLRHYDRIAALAGIDIHSLLAVPLEYKESVIGVIEAVNKVGRPFDEHDLSLLIVLANSVASAIENARLFEAEREQRRLVEQSQTQLVRSEKLAATGRLAASLAHEINNPLQAIHNSLRLLRTVSLEPDEEQECLQMADEEVERLVDIVTRILDFARPSRREKQPTDVNDVVERTLTLAYKYLQHGQIALRRDLSPDLAPIEAVSGELEQVFLNLMLNAVDSMPDGGSLRVSSCLTGDGLVAIAVSDTGTGISPEHLDRIFEPFFSTKEGGTGLGLSISYGVVEQHGGEITVQSAVGEGTTFTVQLPVLVE